MSSLKNKVQLVGMIGKIIDAKNNISSNGNLRFTLITTEKYNDSSGKRIVKNQSHLLIASGKVADVLKNLLTVGKEIAVEGKLNYRRRVDNTGHITEIIVSELLILNKSIS